MLLGKLYGVVQNGYFIDISIPRLRQRPMRNFSDLLFLNNSIMRLQRY